MGIGRMGMGRMGSRKRDLMTIMAKMKNRKEIRLEN